VKIFVYEHVTGGGMAGAALPPGLLHEADLMVRRLLDDLLCCPGVELLTTRDRRLPPVPGIRTMPVRPTDDLRAVLARGIQASDAVWPTAPETGGALEHLAAAVLERGRILLGSRPEAVRVAASKLATARTLRAAGIPVVETFASPDEIPPLPGRWVTKPDDGAGAEGVRIAADWTVARSRLAATDQGVVAQPWIEGESLSLSLLCAEGDGVLVSVNRQVMRVARDEVVLDGIEVNALGDESGAFADLGTAIAAALPGLWGYVGVDLITNGKDLRVLEVNPRLTTSYCGLQAALGIGIASQVLALLEPGTLALPTRRGTMVHLSLKADHG
jgi:predicted ATP-grasp superfamily ATP-dependent carboligase